MTEREALRLGRYMQSHIDLLQIGDWEVEMHLHDSGHVPESEGGGEQCSGHLKYQLRQCWAKLDVAENHLDARQTIIHELVHLLLAPMLAALKRIEPHVEPAVFELLVSQYDDEEERAVTRIAQALRALELQAEEE